MSQNTESTYHPEWQNSENFAVMIRKSVAHYYTQCSRQCIIVNKDIRVEKRKQTYFHIEITMANAYSKFAAIRINVQNEIESISSTRSFQM